MGQCGQQCGAGDWRLQECRGWLVLGLPGPGLLMASHGSSSSCRHRIVPAPGLLANITNSLHPPLVSPSLGGDSVDVVVVGRVGGVGGDGGDVT